MHFTFLYDGAAERTAEYPTLEEAVRSIELGQVDRTTGRATVYGQTSGAVRSVSSSDHLPAAHHLRLHPDR